MKIKIIIFFISLLICNSIYSFGLNEIVVVVNDSEGISLIGANVFLTGTNIGASSNNEGKAYLKKIPSGDYELVVSFIGFEDYRKELSFPKDNNRTILIDLEAESTDMQSVVVTSTRSSRTVEDEPTRIGVITAEELDENAMMNSANIGELLRETTGVQIQQLSQSTSNSTIRIHGLDGKYTQILKDGFPLYSGFAGSMSLLQIPPLDLRQIEVIKGSNSTLYGGGAVGGIINLMSKTPSENFVLDFMFNQTSALGTTVNGFTSGNSGDIGYTFYLSGDYQKEKDTDEDNFTNIPYSNSFSVNPTLFYTFSESSELSLRLNYTKDYRKGGDILSFKDSDFYFFEKSKTDRISSQAKFNYKLSSTSNIVYKNSFAFFRRELKIPDFSFGGDQVNHFSELTYALDSKQFSWIFGADIRNENFDDFKSLIPNTHNYSSSTTGLFIQNTFDINEKSILESGIRTDYNTDYGWFVLPRIAFLQKFSKNLISRLTGGFGYNLPSIFNDETEEMYFRNIKPITNNLNPEKSFSVDWDINYNKVFGNELFISISQLFFYNIIYNGLVLNKSSSDKMYSYSNADGNTTGKGYEANIKAGYRDMIFYLNYSYNNVKVEDAGEIFSKPLTPLHTVGASIIYEEEDNWTVGFELYYTGQQYLKGRFKTSDYWMTGFMVMKKIDNISLFINFENFTDTKQSDYQRLVSPPRTNPTFKEIWAPIDGFIFNGGFKISFSD